jgi:hypothetical protein
MLCIRHENLHRGCYGKFLFAAVAKRRRPLHFLVAAYSTINVLPGARELARRKHTQTTFKWNTLAILAVPRTVGSARKTSFEGIARQSINLAIWSQANSCACLYWYGWDL